MTISAESCQRGRSNRYRAIVSPHEEQTGEPIRIDVYGNNKGKQPALSQLWLDKSTSYDAHIVHNLDFKHATVKERHCRTMCRTCLVGKRNLPQLELAETFDIVWDIDLIYSLKSSMWQVKMTSKTPDHIHWKTFLRAVSNKEDVYDILAGNL